MRFKHFDQLGKIGQRPSQPVNLLDNDHIDLTGTNILQKRLQSRPLQRATRVPAVIIAGFDQSPALVRLALDIGLSSFTLSMKGVEILLQSLL